jgi:hypothetical protein
MDTRWAARFKVWFDTKGLGWQLTFFLATGAIAIGVAGLLWFRDTLGDVITADLEVWHLVVLALVIIAALLVRQRASTPGAGRRYVPAPEEIRHLGVLWPIESPTYSGGLANFKVGKPMCPSHRSTLGIELASDTVVSLTSYPNPITGGAMKFRCPNDGARYDLTGRGLSMEHILNEVRDLAWGEYRTARARAQQQ